MISSLSFTRTFMELKRTIRRLNWNSFFSFTRTFMELKRGTLTGDRCRSHCFTRTFMELKHQMAKKTIISRAVLLVPLWN